jgi:hypothetical protein
VGVALRSMPAPAYVGGTGGQAVDVEAGGPVAALIALRIVRGAGVSAPAAKGDTVAVHDRFVQAFRRAYGDDATVPRTVLLVDEGTGRKRLVDGPPYALWLSQARIVKRAGK